MSTVPTGITVNGMNKGVEMDNNVNKKGNFLKIIGIIFGILLMLFFATMLYIMTSYVGSMAKAVDTMSVEVVSLNGKFDMMNNNMLKVKESMATMNTNIHGIQSQMAHDIDAMSSSVENMSSSMGDINTHVKEMNSNMGSMKTDMNTGVRRLTPRGFMQSFMP